MGYTTEFKGRFTLDKPLSQEQADYLRQFNETRRMRRNAHKVEKLADPKRIAVGLPLGGPEAPYFVGGLGFAGQENDASVLDHNSPPNGQPGLWCQWVPTEDRTGIEWDGGEKFYDYEEWIQYLIDHFLKPWGYALTGRVSWRGESFDDRGVLVATGDKVEAKKGKPEPEEDDGEHSNDWDAIEKNERDWLLAKLEAAKNNAPDWQRRVLDAAIDILRDEEE